MRIVIHIGWHKTGSTALQSFFEKNRQKLFAQKAALYPESGRLKFSHHYLAWSLQEPLRSSWAKMLDFQATPEQSWNAVLEEAEERGAGSVLISSEDFCLLRAEEIARLGRVVSGHDVQIVAYLRRQDEYVESSYRMQVRTYASKMAEPFERYFSQTLTYPVLDYHGVLQMWGEVFGPERIVPRIYLRTRFAAGDVRRDFLATTGLEGDYDFAASNANDSVGFATTRVMQCLNQFELSQDMHTKLVTLLDSCERELGAGGRSLMSKEQRRELLANFQESNRRLGGEYFGGEDPFADLSTTGANLADGESPEAFTARVLNAALQRVLR